MPPNIQQQIMCGMHTLFSVNPLNAGVQACVQVYTYLCAYIHIYVEVCLYPQTCGSVTASLFRYPPYTFFETESLTDLEFIK